MNQFMKDQIDSLFNETIRGTLIDDIEYDRNEDGKLTLEGEKQLGEVITYLKEKVNSIHIDNIDWM